MFLLLYAPPNPALTEQPLVDGVLQQRPLPSCLLYTSLPIPPCIP